MSINKKTKSVKKNNFLTYKKYKKTIYKQKKRFIVKSSKLIFKKKFIINCYYNNKNRFMPLVVCNISGKYKSNITKLWFKKHSFKKYLTFNLISSFFKKSKVCIIFINLLFLKIVIN